MLRSKLLVFDGNDSQDCINREIAKYEEDGWEVAEHRLAMAHGGVTLKVRITVLFQKRIETEDEKLCEIVVH